MREMSAPQAEPTPVPTTLVAADDPEAKATADDNPSKSRSPLPSETESDSQTALEPLTALEFEERLRDYLQAWEARYEARKAKAQAQGSTARARDPMSSQSSSSRNFDPAVSGLPSHQLRQIASILSEEPGDWNAFRWCPPLRRPTLYLRIGFGVNQPESLAEETDDLDEWQKERRKRGYSERDLHPPGTSQLLEFTMEWPRDKKGSGGKLFGSYADGVDRVDEINRAAGERLLNITSEMREQARADRELSKLVNSRSVAEAKDFIRSRMTRNVSDRYMPQHPVISNSLKEHGGEFACLIIDRMNSVAHTAFGMSVVPPSAEVTTIAETEDALKMAYFGDGVERDSVLLDLGHGSTDEILKKARQQQLDLLLIFDLNSEETKLSTKDWAAIYADWSKEWPRPESNDIDQRSPVPAKLQRAARRDEEKKQERKAILQLAREQSVIKTTVTPRVIDVQSGKLLGDTSAFSINNLDVEIHRITTGRLCYRMLKRIKKNTWFKPYFEQYDPLGFQAALNETMQKEKLSKYQRESLGKMIDQHVADIKPDPAVLASWKFVSTLAKSFRLADIPAGLNPQNASQRATDLLNGEMTVAALSELSYYRQRDQIGPEIFDDALLKLLGHEDVESYRSGKILERASLLAKHCAEPERVLAELEELANPEEPKADEAPVVSKANLPETVSDKRAAQPQRSKPAAQSTIQVPARYQGLWRLRAVSFDEGKTVKQDNLSPFVFVKGDQIQSRVPGQPNRRVVEVRERGVGCILVLENKLAWTLLDTDEGATKVIVYAPGGKEVIRYLVVIQ